MKTHVQIQLTLYYKTTRFGKLWTFWLLLKTFWWNSQFGYSFKWALTMGTPYFGSSLRGDPNYGQVRYSNGKSVLPCRMVQNLIATNSCQTVSEADYSMEMLIICIPCQNLNGQFKIWNLRHTDYCKAAFTLWKLSPLKRSFVET